MGGDRVVRNVVTQHDAVDLLDVDTRRVAFEKETVYGGAVWSREGRRDIDGKLPLTSHVQRVVGRRFETVGKHVKLWRLDRCLDHAQDLVLAFFRPDFVTLD